MIAVATAGISGRQMGLPQGIAHVILMTLGLSLGAMVSPALIKNLSAYPLTIALLAAATFCATFGSSLYLQRIHGWDRTSALLAGSPGALSQVIMLATEKNADVAGIAVVQIMRVIILTAMVPLLLAATGMMGHGPLPSRGAAATPLALAELAVMAIVVSLLLRWLKFPASWMFGAMLGSSVLHGTGMVDGTLPQWAYVTALIGIGTLIGSRFGKIRPRTILSHIGAALGSFVVAVVISAVFVALIALTTSVKFSDVVVAFAPGAMDAMLALALTLHIDPVFVGAHHLSRFIFVSIATPGIVHLFGKAQDDLDD
jgi:membrane AbrB-like protein